VWKNEVVPLLEAAPGIRAVAIFEEICRRHPAIAPGVRQTLERRIAKWRALKGPQPRCDLPPGASAGSMGGLGITIAGAAFEHRIYDFRLPVVLAGRVLWPWPRAYRMRCGRWAA
jgi:hypothetical protein